jgi:hypothetical protein
MKEIEPITGTFSLKERATLIDYLWSKPQPLDEYDAALYTAMVKDLKRYVAEMKETP